MSTFPLNHLRDTDLIAYVHRQLSDADRESFDRHLEQCLDCRRRLVDHADFRHRLGEDLVNQLAQVRPVTDWSAIAPRVHKPRAGRLLAPRRPGTASTSRRFVYAAMVAAYAVVLLVAGVLLFTIIRNFVRNQQVVSLVDEPTLTVTATPVLGGVMITPGATIVPSVTPAPGLPVWDGSERVNLLLMGIDQRANQQGYWRTDTLIIVTIDPQARTVGMISIPRDLWVPIWAYGMENRINTAHYYGDVNDYPGGGPALARDTVTYNLGIPIHFYVRLNFTAFERLIDEIGGIDIFVEETINDSAYPDEGIGYDPFYLPAGQRHLDGETALKYARTRHGSNDFERARRQQRVILAIRDRVVSLNQLPRLIVNGPQILSALGDSVRTDMSFDQAVQLAQIANDIPPEAIRGAVIDQNYTQPYKTGTGAQVLIPLRDKISALYESFFQTP